MHPGGIFYAFAQSAPRKSLYISVCDPEMGSRSTFSRPRPVIIETKTSGSQGQASGL